MSLFKRFTNWLASTKDDAFRKGHPDLNPIDVTQLIADLRLVEEARRLAEKNIPASNETSLSGPEAQALQRVEKCRQDYVDWAKTRLGIINTDLERHDITGRVNQARQADREFERKAGATLSQRESMLRGLRQSMAQSLAELEAFKADHRLKREARYPTGAWRLFGVALLVALTIVEGLANAQFFAVGVSGGLLEGFVSAFLLAGFNVGVAYFFGRAAVRYINHRDLLPKLIGGVALAGSIALMVAIGLGIAHFRDALTSEMPDAAKAALDSFGAAPTILRDVFSWMLFGITVTFGLIALIDGYKADDPYPGYGRVDRAARSAQEDYVDELDQLREEVNQLKEEDLKLLEDTLRHANSSIAMYAELIQSKSEAQSRLMTALRNTDNSLDAVLKQFRTENELHRTTARPPYFSDSPKLRKLELPNFDTSDDRATLLSQKELLNSLVNDVQDIRGRIQAAFNVQFDRLKPLDSNFLVEETQ